MNNPKKRSINKIVPKESNSLKMTKGVIMTFRSELPRIISLFSDEVYNNVSRYLLIGYLIAYTTGIKH